jgi:hypothetical protein
MTGTTLTTKGEVNVLIRHKDYLKIGLFLDELRGLFEELSDEELDNAKKIAIRESEKCSDRATTQGKHTRHTRP